MTLYQIAITNHMGFPFYHWLSPNIHQKIINLVKFTRYPSTIPQGGRRDFELECGYIAAMSISARTQGMEVIGMRKQPKAHDVEGNAEHDIIFDLEVDTYMNERNLQDRLKRVVDNIIFTGNRERLDDNFFTDDEEIQLRNIFHDLKSRTIINNKMLEISEAIRENLKVFKGEEKSPYKHGVLGVGILSSSYNILFYKGLETLINTSDDDMDFIGIAPDTESDLDEILSSTQIPFGIEGGESKLAYPYKGDLRLVIHNFDVGPTILGVKEPFHLIVVVREGFPSTTTIEDIIRALTPLLNDE